MNRIKLHLKRIVVIFSIALLIGVSSFATSIILGKRISITFNDKFLSINIVGLEEALASATQYGWVNAIPRQTDDTHFEWINGTPYIYMNITASGTPSLTNSPDTEALGILAVNTTYYAFGSAPNNPVQDGDCTFIITNDGTSAIDVDMNMADFTGGVGWNIDATPEADEVKITAYYSGQDPSAGLVLTNLDQEFYDGLAASAHIHWDFACLTGTSFTDGVAKSGVLTITATSED